MYSSIPGMGRNTNMYTCISTETSLIHINVPHCVNDLFSHYPVRVLPWCQTTKMLQKKLFPHSTNNSKSARAENLYGNVQDSVYKSFWSNIAKCLGDLTYFFSLGYDWGNLSLDETNLTISQVAHQTTIYLKVSMTPVTQSKIRQQMKSSNRLKWLDIIIGCQDSSFDHGH